MTMTGRLGGKQTIHDVDASWVLTREYERPCRVKRRLGTYAEPANPGAPPDFYNKQGAPEMPGLKVRSRANSSS